MKIADQINKMWSIAKMNKIGSFKVMWMNVEPVMQMK